MINKVTLLGRLGKDPEVRHFENNNAVCNFSLATNRSYKKGEEWVDETEWHNIVIWKPWLIKSAEKFLKKGSLLYIEGRITTRMWEDQGVKKYITDILVEDMKLLDKKPEGSGGNFPPPPTAADAPATINTASEDVAPTTDDPADDLPF